MKVSLSSWLAAAWLLPTAFAFLQMSAEQLKAYQEHAKRSLAACAYSQEKRDASECPFTKEKRAAKFDAKKQRISISGEHELLPPTLKAGDQRGPCPGLNALANHGYLPRNGVADMQTIIKATNEVYGTVFNGNPVSLDPGYCIGGPSRFSQNILNGGGILGTPSDLSGSHNKYESDVSATRGDLYVTGDNYHVILDRFVEYWSAIRENTPAPEQYSALAPFHYKSFQDPEKTNSHFFYSPFAGILVSPAAYSFPLRMMANHSDKYAEGYLSREAFTSFFDVKSSKPGNFKVNQGWERIPKNGYRRPVEDGFSIPNFLVDVLGSQFTDVTKALTPLADKLRQLLAGKTCPKLQKVNTKLFEKFPGYTESYGSYAGVSKGPLRGVIDGVGGILGGLLTTGNKAYSVV